VRVRLWAAGLIRHVTRAAELTEPEQHFAECLVPGFLLPPHLSLEVATDDSIWPEITTVGLVMLNQATGIQLSYPELDPSALANTTFR
jgi:hypothetical protein